MYQDPSFPLPFEWTLMVDFLFLFLIIVPTVERIVYSTCSIHQIENEDVVHSVLHLASSHGFQLETASPRWPRRGLPTLNGSEHLLQTDLTIDKEGFIIALFIWKCVKQSQDRETNAENQAGSVRRKNVYRTRKPLNVFVGKILKAPPYTRLKLSNKRVRALASPEKHTLRQSSPQ